MVSILLLESMCFGVEKLIFLGSYDMSTSVFIPMNVKRFKNVQNTKYTMLSALFVYAVLLNLSLPILV